MHLNTMMTNIDSWQNIGKLEIHTDSPNQMFIFTNIINNANTFLNLKVELIPSNAKNVIRFEDTSGNHYEITKGETAKLIISKQEDPIAGNLGISSIEIYGKLQECIIKQEDHLIISTLKKELIKTKNKYVNITDAIIAEVNRMQKLYVIILIIIGGVLYQFECEPRIISDIIGKLNKNV